MLSQFRDTYPMGSIVTDLVRVEEGIFIVRAQVIVNTITLGTGLAGASRIEEAEEAALKRALTHAGFNPTPFKPLPTPPYAGIPNGATPPWTPPPEREIKPEPKPALDSGDPEDLSELIAQTSVEMERAGWSTSKGRDYIKRTYGKEARSQLTREELRSFLQYLQQQPTPGHTSPF
ncbi:MAG: hypothetical protein Q6K99_06610 [Thermostichales cyanobacterium BF4_bins_65]